MDITHEVFNQPEPLVNYNLFAANQPLRDALKFNAPGLDTAELTQLGARLGTTDMQTHARLANVHAPELHTHDRFGRRIDQVEFHPSYHVLMSAAVGAGLHGTPWAEMAPTLVASRTTLPPGGAELRLGRPGAAFVAPTLVASRTTLPAGGGAAPAARLSRFRGPRWSGNLARMAMAGSF